MVLFKNIDTENDIECTPADGEYGYLHSTFEPYEAVTLPKTESDDEFEYCLISVPFSASLEALNGVEIALDDIAENVPIPGYDYEYLNMKNNEALSQVYLKPVAQIEDDENMLSFCSLKNRLKLTKVLPSSHDTTPVFFPKTQAPPLPTDVKRRNILFGSDSIARNRKEFSLVSNNKSSSKKMVKETNEATSRFSGSDDMFNSSTNADCGSVNKKHKKKKHKVKDESGETEQHQREQKKKRKLSGSINVPDAVEDVPKHRKHKKKKSKNLDKSDPHNENEVEEKQIKHSKKKKRKHDKSDHELQDVSRATAPVNEAKQPKKHKHSKKKKSVDASQLV